MSRFQPTAALVGALLFVLAASATAAPSARGPVASAATATADQSTGGDASSAGARLIVGLHDGGHAHGVLSALRGGGLLASDGDVRRSGGRLVGRFTRGALAALRADPRVAYVEPDQVVTTVRTTQAAPPQGLDRLDQRDLPLSVSYTYDRTGAGVRVYVVDTGVRASHVDFGGRVEPGFDARGDATTADCNGHGTHVAGTAGGAVHGVAKEVVIVPVRVLDCAGVGSASDVATGIDWVTANHPGGAPGVVNLSLGSDPSRAVDDAVRRAVASGLTVVTAAGNTGEDACGSSPARVAEAITVTASDPLTDRRPAFANFGPCVDVFAPGVEITSTWWTTDTALVRSSGTSMAAPHVAGVAAKLLQEGTITPDEVHVAVASNATPGRVGDAGPGTPNLLAFSSFGPLPDEPAPGDEPAPAPIPGPALEPALDPILDPPLQTPQPEPEPEPDAGAPSPPRDVRAVAGELAVQVSWSPPADSGGSPVTGYTIHASPPGATRTVGADTTTATVTGLEADTTYRFVVAAINARGESVPSEPSNAVTPLPPADAGPAEPRAQEACPQGEVPPAGFGDTAGSVHEAAIDCVVWYGITQGTGMGLYGPRVSVRRDQMASFVTRQLRAAGVALPPPSDQGFTDITGNVHAAAINQLAALGVAQGTSATTFSPATDVRRDQLATFLDRAHEQITGARLPQGPSQFTDVEGSVHANSVHALAAAEIVQGVAPGTYAPTRPVRRDQMAAFLARHLGVLAEAGHLLPPQ